MRIAFDGTALQPHRTGVGYYTEHLLRHVAEEATSDDVVVISNRKIDTARPLPARLHRHEATSSLPRQIWTQVIAPRALRELDADVAHFTNGMMPVASPVPTVVTIHDMSLHLYPQYHPPRRVLLNRPLMNFAARHAAAIITVSESAKRDIVRLYGIDAGRVHVIHEAASPAFRPVHDKQELARVRRRYKLADRIVLYVGTIEPRKNLPRLIDAFAARSRAGELDHQLVCVGPYGWLSRDLTAVIERSGVADRIAFTGYVPFDDLPVFYSLAEMFVFPSLHEGFGLPVIEAMACGVPVVTARASSMTEIAGDAVAQIDPLDTNSIGDVMARLAANPAERERLARLGYERAQHFSWQRAARQTLDIYRSVARQPKTATVSTVTSPTDVLFGQAYYLRFDRKLWEARQPYAPLGSLYAAAVVREHGYDVGFFDAMLAASEVEWAAALDARRPRFAVIYEDNFNYLSKMCLLRMRQAALTMIEAAKTRGITTIVAGSDATDHADIYLDRGADVVIAGEGEATITDVLDVLSGRSQKPLEAVAGICLARRESAPLRTAARPVLRNLDSLPLPAWDLVDVEAYKRIWRKHHGRFSMNLVTTRGCPYHCNWCAKPIYGQRYAVRSPANVVEEMAWLKEHYQPDHLWIMDDIFGLQPGWIKQFAQLVTARDAVIPFKCLLRADQVTASVAVALKTAGCRTVWIGAESGSQRILDAMDKGIRVEQIYEASGLLRAAQLEVGFFLQFGYPGETREDVDLTRRMVRDCRPDDIGISVSYPLPGTPFYERVKDQLGRKQNWLDSDDLSTMYRATYVPEFYRALHALVHNEFRTGKLAQDLTRSIGLPTRWRLRRFYSAVSIVAQRLKHPILRRRVDRLETLSPEPMVDPRPAPASAVAAVPVSGEAPNLKAS